MFMPTLCSRSFIVLGFLIFTSLSYAAEKSYLYLGEKPGGITINLPAEMRPNPVMTTILLGVYSVALHTVQALVLKAATSTWVMPSPNNTVLS